MKIFTKTLVACHLACQCDDSSGASCVDFTDVTVLSGEAPSVTFDMAVSNSLFNFDHVPVGNASLIIHTPNGELVEPENLFTGKFRTVFDLTLKRGTYHIAIAKPKGFLRNGKMMQENAVLS